MVGIVLGPLVRDGHGFLTGAGTSFANRFWIHDSLGDLAFLFAEYGLQDAGLARLFVTVPSNGHDIFQPTGRKGGGLDPDDTDQGRRRRRRVGQQGVTLLLVLLLFLRPRHLFRCLAHGGNFSFGIPQVVWVAGLWWWLERTSSTFGTGSQIKLHTGPFGGLSKGLNRLLRRGIGPLEPGHGQIVDVPLLVQIQNNGHDG